MPVFVDGHHLITPTSVAKTGTGSTATINTNGSVTFSSCETLSLNGVFSADYDNYMIVIRHLSTLNGSTIRARLRASGTDNTTASSYVDQFLDSDSATVSGARATRDYWAFAPADDSQRSGTVANIYGPYLAQPTAFRTVSASGYSNAWLVDYAGTHNQSTAYDGISLYQATGSFGGLLAVYGAVK